MDPKKTIKWIEKLQTDSINFPVIGEMKLNNHGKIQFLPSNEINFNKNNVINLMLGSRYDNYLDYK